MTGLFNLPSGIAFSDDFGVRPILKRSVIVWMTVIICHNFLQFICYFEGKMTLESHRQIDNLQ